MFQAIQAGPQRDKHIVKSNKYDLFHCPSQNSFMQLTHCTSISVNQWFVTYVHTYTHD